MILNAKKITLKLLNLIKLGMSYITFVVVYLVHGGPML
jgi:hypothetical protein